MQEKLEAVPRSVLKIFFRYLEMNTSTRGTSSSSGSGSDKRSLDRSSDRPQDASPTSYQAVQMEHQTKYTNFKNSFASKRSISCLNLSPQYYCLIFSYCRFFSLFFPQESEAGMNTTSRTAYLFSSSSTSLPGTAAHSTYKTAQIFLFSFQVTTFFCEELRAFISCSTPERSSW